MSTSKVEDRVQCPRCKDTGNDNLVLYSDGHGHCYACGYRVRTNGNSIQSKKTAVIKLKDVVQCTEFRQVSEASLKKYQVLSEYDSLTKSGQPVLNGVVVFPYYDDAGKLIGIKYRDFLAESEGSKKKDTIWAEGTMSLYGLHAFNSNLKTTFIFEGETDLITAAEYLPDANLLAIPGTSHVSKLSEYMNVLKTQSQIILCFDADKAGLEATEKAKALFPSYQLFILKPDLAEAEDIRDALESSEDPGKTLDFLLNNLQGVVSNNIITGDKLVSSCSDFFDYLDTDDFFVSTGFNNIDEMLGGGLSPGEALLLTGHTGIGKSQLCANIAYNIMGNNVPVLWIGTEMQFTLSAFRFIELHYEEKLTRKKYSSGWTIDSLRRKKALEYLSDRVYFYHGDLTWENIKESIITSIHKYNVRVVFIDVLEDIDPGMYQYEFCSQVMKEITMLASGDVITDRPPVTMVLVGHTVKRNGVYSKRIRIDDIALGKAVHKKVTAVLTFEGEVDETVRRMRVIKKSRMFGSNLLHSHLEFDLESMKFYEE